MPFGQSSGQRHGSPSPWPTLDQLQPARTKSHRITVTFIVERPPSAGDRTSDRLDRPSASTGDHALSPPPSLQHVTEPLALARFAPVVAARGALAAPRRRPSGVAPTVRGAPPSLRSGAVVVLHAVGVRRTHVPEAVRVEVVWAGPGATRDQKPRDRDPNHTHRSPPTLLDIPLGTRRPPRKPRDSHRSCASHTGARRQIGRTQSCKARPGRSSTPCPPGNPPTRGTGPRVRGQPWTGRSPRAPRATG